MLDDLKYIHSKDADDALGIAANQWQQLKSEYNLSDLNYDIENVVFAGMGGSALAALLSTTWPGCKLPFQIWRKYELPAYVNEKTLLIISSYSGNTEETISALDAGAKAGAQIVVVAGGGKLIEIAKDKNYPYALLPKASQPRFGALNGLKALVTIFERAGIIESGSIDKLASSAEFLKNEIATWLPDVVESKNPAKQLALNVAGSSPVIYGGPLTFPAAYKWKISFNENAKNVAWCNEIPEFSHNEFLGWTSHPVDKPYSVIDLRSSLEHERVQKRFTVTEKLLSGKRPHPYVVEAKGSDELEQMLYLVVFGDFVSLYVALINGLNPTPVDLIEKMKNSLDS